MVVRKGGNRCCYDSSYFENLRPYCVPFIARCNALERPLWVTRSRADHIACAAGPPQYPAPRAGGRPFRFGPKQTYIALFEAGIPESFPIDFDSLFGPTSPDTCRRMPS